MDPIQISAKSTQLLAAAGQAAAADQAAAQTVSTDQQAITDLNQKLTVAQQALAADQGAAQKADQSSNAAYVALCQSLAADLGIPLPQTIPAA